MAPHGHFGRKKRFNAPRNSELRDTPRSPESIVFSSASPNPPAHTSNKKNSPPLPKHILQGRAHMGEEGVLVLSFLLDEKSKTLLRPVRLESRWFLLPNEVRFAHSILQKAARSSYETTLLDVPDIEERELLRIIKQDIERVSEQQLRRVPLIIPIFHFL